MESAGCSGVRVVSTTSVHVPFTHDLTWYFGQMSSTSP